MAWTVSSVRVRAPRIALFLGLIAGSLASFPSPLSAQTVSPRDRRVRPVPRSQRLGQRRRGRERVRAALFRRRKHAAATRHRARQTERPRATARFVSTSRRCWARGRWPASCTKRVSRRSVPADRRRAPSRTSSCLARLPRRPHLHRRHQTARTACRRSRVRLASASTTGTVGVTRGHPAARGTRRAIRRG